MSVLITGGAGYIGSHTAKRFAQAGVQTVVIDNLSRGHRESVKWSPLVVADVGDESALREIFRNYTIDAVIHFAAFAYVGESMGIPDVYFQNNLMQTLHLLNAMHQHNVRKIVFSSTCATYGEPMQASITEDHVQRPVNPYGESKLMVERLLHWYGVAYGLSWVALRYFNAAGADPDGELGEHHQPETHLIPLAIASALRVIPYLEIYGTDYRTPDGTAIRDYLHVTDLADAHWTALQYLNRGGESTAFNLGTGRGASVRDVIAAVERVAGCEVPVREVARRAGDPSCLVADCGKANRMLGWHARRSSLEEIAQTAWNWKTKSAERQTASGVSS